MRLNSATNGRELKAKAKGKKWNLPLSMGKLALPKESSFDKVPLQLNETGNFSPNNSPIQIFELFCNDEFFQLPVDQSNLNNTQGSTEGYEVAVMSNRKRRRSYKKVAAVTISEMKHFFGIILFMGIHKIPNRRMYWGKFTLVPAISTITTRNRFDEILSIFHFNNNTTAFLATSPITTCYIRFKPLSTISKIDSRRSQPLKHFKPLIK